MTSIIIMGDAVLKTELQAEFRLPRHARSDLMRLPASSACTKPAPARLQRLSGRQVIAALKGFIHTSAFAKSRAVLRMLRRMGCRALGTLKGFLPFALWGQAPATPQHLPCALKVPAPLKASLEVEQCSAMERCLDWIPLPSAIPPGYKQICVDSTGMGL